jgi:histidinol-phosphate aminotransferase
MQIQNDLLCSPNNPTGIRFLMKVWLLYFKILRGLVVIDEAYIDFSKKQSWLNELDEYPN